MRSAGFRFGRTLGLPTAVLVLCLAALFFLVDPLAERVVSEILKENFNGEVRIGGFRTGFPGSKAELTEMTLMSPPGFSGEPMLLIAGAFADYRLRPLLNRNLVLDRVTLDVEELTLVRNREGRLNVEEAVREDRRVEEAEGRGDSREQYPDKPWNVWVKLATVEIRRIVYKEYRPGQKPFVMTLPARSARIRVQDINLNDILEALKDLGSMSPKAGMPFPLPGILMNKWGKALGSGEPGGTP